MTNGYWNWRRSDWTPVGTRFPDLFTQTPLDWFESASYSDLPSSSSPRNHEWPSEVSIEVFKMSVKGKIGFQSRRMEFDTVEGDNRETGVPLWWVSRPGSLVGPVTEYQSRWALSQCRWWPGTRAPRHLQPAPPPSSIPNVDPQHTSRKPHGKCVASVRILKAHGQLIYTVKRIAVCTSMGSGLFSCMLFYKILIVKLITAFFKSCLKHTSSVSNHIFKVYTNPIK